MGRIAYIFALIAILTGCSAEELAKTESPAPPQPQETVAQPVPAPPQSGTQPASEPDKSAMSIAGKSEADVEALLGKPTETETGEWTLMPSEDKTPFVRHVYAAEIGTVDVMFIEGKAARIEVKPKETFTFPDDAIKAMRAAGLTVEDGLEPESGAPHFLDFVGIDGVYAVRVVKDLEGNPGNIGYVKIVTEERYK